MGTVQDSKYGLALDKECKGFHSAGFFPQVPVTHRVQSLLVSTKREQGGRLSGSLV